MQLHVQAWKEMKTTRHAIDLITLIVVKTCKMVLYEESRKEIEILITARISKIGKLMIEGIDSGPLVKELRGDLDYEYFLSVSLSNKLLLIEYLQLNNFEVRNDQELLVWLMENFNKNDCFSSIMALLKQAEIEFETFFWD